MEKQNNCDKRTSAHIFVRGVVQGVGYRNFCCAIATELQLRGTVRNMADGRVELEASGDRPDIDSLILKLRVGPSLSRVDAVDVSWEDASDDYKAFSISY